MMTELDIFVINTHASRLTRAASRFASCRRQQADAEVAAQLEAREEQREQRDAAAREAHHRGEPRALGRREDVRVGSQDDPRQAERDKGVEGEGPKSVGGGHRVHARPVAQHDDRDQVGQPCGEAERRGAQRVLAHTEQADRARGHRYHGKGEREGVQDAHEHGERPEPPAEDHRLAGLGHRVREEEARRRQGDGVQPTPALGRAPLPRPP
eukprot:scaffold116807_cov63-Phaeocystis_antarctica.AAC.2